MKIFSLAALVGLIAGLAVTLEAQNGTLAERPASPVISAKAGANPFGDFGLSAEQKDKLQALKQELNPKMQAVYTNQMLSVAEKQQKMNEIQADRTKGLREIFTPEQWALYESNQKSMREKALGFRRGQTNHLALASPKGGFSAIAAGSNASSALKGKSFSSLSQPNTVGTNAVKTRKQMLTNAAMMVPTSLNSGVIKTRKETRQNGFAADGTQSLQPASQQADGLSSAAALDTRQIDSKSVIHFPISTNHPIVR